jgi:hypothetical protein
MGRYRVEGCRLSALTHVDLRPEPSSRGSLSYRFVPSRCRTACPYASIAMGSTVNRSVLKYPRWVPSKQCTR